jgi:hypothetical protein
MPTNDVIIPVGIGPVKDYKGLAVLSTRLHDIAHGSKVGIEPCAYILDVIDNNIDAFKVFRKRLLFSAIKAGDSDTGYRIST